MEMLAAIFLMTFMDTSIPVTPFHSEHVSYLSSTGGNTDTLDHIPQLDGILDSPFSDASTGAPAGSSSVPSESSLQAGTLASANSTSVSSLVAKFTLNRQKQLDGLARSSRLPDFDILINDSGKNVIVQCSTGFYEAVAKPSFSSLSRGFSLDLFSIFVECIESRSMIDMSDSVPGLMLKFKLHGPGVHPNPVPLTVHLHHTKQKIQIQGGGKMPDNSTAATWFTQSILRERFLNEARNKKLDINSINKVVLAMSSQSPLSSGRSETTTVSPVP